MTEEVLIFYHGTDAANVESIETHGLRPRSANNDVEGTWKGRSHPECVYLTNNLHVARRFAQRFDKGAVFEVTLTSDEALRADDNFLWYRFLKEESVSFDQCEELDTWNALVATVPKDNRWKDSLKEQELCSHHGTIPPSQIKKVDESTRLTFSTLEMKARNF